MKENWKFLKKKKDDKTISKGKKIECFNYKWLGYVSFVGLES